MKPVAIPLSELPDDFRAFAVEWCGFDPWERSLGGSPWWPVYSRHDLPLSVPMGWTLGVAYGRHIRARWASCFPPLLAAFPHLPQLQQRLGHAGDDLIATLADIPEHCPTCRGVTSEVLRLGPGDGCGHCIDGTNPRRAAMALAACLAARPDQQSDPNAIQEQEVP